VGNGAEEQTAIALDESRRLEKRWGVDFRHHKRIFTGKAKFVGDVAAAAVALVIIVVLFGAWYRPTHPLSSRVRADRFERSSDINRDRSK